MRYVITYLISPISEHLSAGALILEEKRWQEMKDPYDFIDWSPFSSSLPLANQSYKKRYSTRRREQYKRDYYSTGTQRMLYLYNLVMLVILSILIITSIKQMFNW